MKTKLGHKVLCELEMVGGCYYNNYGVNAYKLTDGNVFIEAVKMGRRIYKANAILTMQHFKGLFRDENLTGWENFKEAMIYLGLWEDEEEQ